ncbi:hypothetical protein PRUPE_7G023400 [Prunus persica]|uniref:L-2-hydroxyglutarate dehydrogenase, mitochondrial n=1 Tax=Prunus persica TaxID=3760 RepID=A0A251N5K9_PRUPE|nr:hypothetical protein PRUPE_7G023400 [Prunus persica]
MLKSKIQSLERISSSSSVVFKILKSRNIATTTGSTSSSGVPKEKVDCVVIGAGVVGLAVARELTLKGREVLVLESASTFGTGISSRNSEVIHAGIYYPPNSLKGEAENHGATFSYNTTVIGGHIEENRLSLHISETKHLENWNGKFPLQPEMVLIPKLVVNSAGLSAPVLAKRFDGLRSAVIPPTYYARGCYFTLSNTTICPFKHLIYPIPEDGGLGVHVTLDLNGQVKFGPNVEWIDGIDDVSSFLNKFDYSVCTNRAKLFYPEIRKYYPNLKDGSLDPGYAGIRPKLSGRGHSWDNWPC